MMGDKECLNCGQNLIDLPGKRKKVFCNSTCRSNYWQKSDRLEKQGKTDIEIVSILAKIAKNNKPKNKKRILAERNAAQKPREPQIQDLNEFTNEVPNLTKEPPKSNYTLTTVNKDEILKQISELEEKIKTVPPGQYYNKVMKIYKDQIHALQNKLIK